MGVEDGAGPGEEPSCWWRTWGTGDGASGEGKSLDPERTKPSKTAWSGLMGHRVRGNPSGPERTRVRGKALADMVESLILAQDQRWRRA